MQTGAIKQAIKAGAKVAQIGIEAERLKDTVTNAVDESVNAAKRAVKQSRYAVEDMVDEATYSVKKHPLQSVGLTLGIGFAIGTMFGLALSRMNITTRCCDVENAQEVLDK